MTDLQVTPRPWHQRFRAGRVPHILHRVWLGDGPMPAEYVAYGETFARCHPGWEMRLWGEADIESLGVTDEDVARARSLSEVSNLVRYSALLRHGGVYVDTDVECKRSFEPLLRGVDAFAALEVPGRIGTAVLAGVREPARHGHLIVVADVFYPYLWTEPERAEEDFPEAYAVHHWAASWMNA